MEITQDNWGDIEDKIAIIGFSTIAISLPFNNLLMSIGIFTVAAAALSRIIRFIILGNYTSRLSGITIILLPAVIWLTTLTGVIGSDDKSHWLWDVRVKLPLLLIPLFAYLFKSAIKVNFIKLSGVFISAISAACIACIWAVLTNNYETGDIRNASLFISHIRFGLMISIVLPLLYFSFEDSTKGKQLKNLLFVTLLFLFLTFDILTANLTGLALLLFGLLFIQAHNTITKYSSQKLLLLIIPIISFMGLALFIIREYNNYSTPYNSELMPSELTSSKGEPYSIYDELIVVEHGRINERYIAPLELDSTWFARTQLNLDSRDGKGQPLKSTVIRYLTSMGQRKDATGVMALSDLDIQNILAGRTHIEEVNRLAIVNRVYAIYFEWSTYMIHGVVSGHSVFQRLEFWRAAWNIIRENLLLGVGPGDVPNAFKKSYEEIGTTLDSSHRLRAHNQFLTFWISFGVIGLIMLFLIFYIPIIRLKSPLMNCFLVICLLSFFTEDTLETQAGVCFFALFYSLFTSARLS